MTTKVTVDAHAGWPVKVTMIYLDGEGKPVSEQLVPPVTVAPHTTQDFIVHSTMMIEVREMPFDALTGAAA